jgi:transcription-repair coupling factor (superfamily II helicase)
MNTDKTSITKTLLSQKQLDISGIIDGSQAYALNQIASATKRDVIFVTINNITAQAITEDFRFLSTTEVSCLLEWDTLAYDLVSPSKNILDKRIETLSQLIAHKKQQNVLVTTANAIVQKIIAPQELENRIFKIKVGEKLNKKEFISLLINNGYRQESSANEIGEFAVRDSIIDVLASGKKHGYRINFFNNKTEYIKTFNPSSQLTQEQRDEITIFPASELVISSQTIQSFECYLINNYGSNAIEAPLLINLKAGIKPCGIEHWAPVFYKNTDSISSYLDNPIIILDNFIKDDITEINKKIRTHYKERLQEIKASHKVNIPLKPEQLCFTKEEFNTTLSQHNVIYCNASESPSSINFSITALENFEQQAKLNNSTIFSELKIFTLSKYQNKKNTVVSCFSEGSRDRIHKILTEHKINSVKTETWPLKTFKPQVHLIISPFTQGFCCEEYILITEQELFGQKLVNIKPEKNTILKSLLSEAQNLSKGELVVHRGYGIGRFDGLETIELSETKHDCLKITYADDDRLFVPVENIELITKYGNAHQTVKLDKLGNSSWQVRKIKIKKLIKESAEYLLQIAAKRSIQKAEIIEPIPGLYDEFCASFPYAETEDQERTILEVKSDLEQQIPMDRLVCGDVGFGKTEVALRAAFITIKSSNQTIKRQVAIICPTTILARQHFNVFSSRFKKFGINVAHLSRLVSPKEGKKIIENINNGKVDIIIGTHALLNAKIKFKNLALLIIDEEQHFGVLQKEKLKKLKENIHILSMSATPIPRTMQMSLAGIKELSLIATPPINRLVTKTTIINFDLVIIKEALLKEYFRGGQSFFICPRISDLPELELKLKKIVPNLKVAVAHGRLQPDILDKIMNDFYEGNFDVLLSTSIIESGLDIPKANTIIVHKAEKFGLGQLYQIRGRVGRSNISSYAYFTVPANKILQPVALKRLEILQAIDQLGSGFSIASHDMDIRGYGNLIGEEQSGHIKEVGVELYQNMLTESIKSLQTTDTSIEKEKWIPQINLGTSVLIPEDYVTDFDVRLNLYQRASNLKENHELIAFAAEMIDRFGPLPTEVEHLVSTIKLKQLCLKSSIKKIDSGKKGIVLQLVDAEHYNFDKLLQFIATNKNPIKIRPDNKILLQKAISNPEKRALYIENFLQEIQPFLLSLQ